MLETGLLAEDQGILWFGRAGEKEFGRRNFMELFSIFQTPPLFSVRHGQTDLGEVHESSFLVRSGERPVLLLAGRGWVTTTIDWVKKIAYVEPSDEIGRSRWIGSGQPLSFAHCQAIKRVLGASIGSERFSRRALEEMSEVRADFTWLAPECTSLVVDAGQGRCYWWTFAGSRANAMLAQRLKTPMATSFDNFSVRFDQAPDRAVLKQAIAAICADPPKRAPVAHQAFEQLKFSACVPRTLAEKMLAIRLSDPDALVSVLNEPLRIVQR